MREHRPKDYSRNRLKEEREVQGTKRGFKVPKETRKEPTDGEKVKAKQD